MRDTKGSKARAFIALLPRAVKIFFVFGAVSVFLLGAYTVSEPFADLFNGHISFVLRRILAGLTDIIPFSLAEFIILLLPVIIIVITSWASLKFSSSWRRVGIFCLSLLSVISLLFSIFVFGFAAGYHGEALDKKLGIERRESTPDELYETARIVLSFANEEAENIIYRADGFSVMPYGYKELNDKLIASFSDFSKEHSFIKSFDSRLKPVMLSEVMSYSHITGMYTFFTGEANINIAFPDYTIPFTAAHELAHQRGIAREDEANFIAYLVCISSDDAYIRYSGYLNMYEYLLNALWRADKTLYKKSLDSLSRDVFDEMVAYNDFFSKYENSTVSNISGAVNDAFLTMQGTGGSASYGMVVDLAVGYYNDR